MYCGKCGKEINDNANFCKSCGAKTNKVYESYSSTEKTNVVQETKPKSRLVAGILGIFLGALGLHRFYLGYVEIGIVQLALNFLCLSVVSAIWGFVEGVLILCGVSITTDSKGIPLEQ